MFRFNRLVCVLVICSLVGVAFGAAVKIKALSAVGAGDYENPDCDGMAIANYHPGHNETEITAAITDFLPDTEYKITVSPGFSSVVTTNESGNANTHAVAIFDICSVGDGVVRMTVEREVDNPVCTTDEDCDDVGLEDFDCLNNVCCHEGVCTTYEIRAQGSVSCPE